MKLKFMILALVLSSCGTLGGSGSTTSSGEQILTGDSIAANFDASLNQDLFRSFTVMNNSGKTQSITNIFFQNNACGSFSVFNITDASGTSLWNPAQPLKLAIADNKQVFVNVRFKPVPCVQVEYETMLVVVFKDDANKPSTNSFILRAFGSPEDQSVSSDECADINGDNVEELFLSGIPNSGTYYFRVNNTRAFIYPEGAKDFADIVGTDLGGIEPGTFIEPFLEVSIDNKGDSGNFILKKIAPCVEFFLPSTVDNPNFGGAPTLLTTEKDFAGIMTRDLSIRETHLDLHNFKILLRTEDIPSDRTNVRNSTGTFQIDIVTNLTTGRTQTDINLGDPLQTHPKFDEGLFNLTETENNVFALQGIPLIDGKMTLVGIATFNNDDDTFLGSTSADQFLLQEKASLYLQLEVSLMEKITESE